MRSFFAWRQRRERNAPPWLTKSLLCEIRKKHLLHQNYRKFAIQEVLAKSKSQYKLFREGVRNTKLLYENQLAQQINKRGFYSDVNNFLRYSRKIGPLMDSQSIPRLSDLEIADLLNKHFSSLSTISFYAFEVERIIKRLRNQSACGPDSFLTFVLKKPSDVISLGCSVSHGHDDWWNPVGL